MMMIVFDLLVLHRKDKVISVKDALLTSGLWIGLAFIFNLGIWFYKGSEIALDFLAGYLIEKSLSIDNLFVFLLIFKYFNTKKEHEHKVLFWGILGAIVMRALFIFFGVELVASFHWVLYLFALFLLYAAVNMVLPKKNINPENNFVIKLLKKFIPISNDNNTAHFFTKKGNQWYATTLFVTLISIETTDVIFAIDSIPAIMAITLDPFIIYTSNIFAIMGLRSLYFALSGVMSLFYLLKYGLAAILAFVAFKMLAESYIDVPITIALGFIVMALAISIAASVIFSQRKTS